MYSSATQSRTRCGSNISYVEMISRRRSRVAPTFGDVLKFVTLSALLLITASWALAQSAKVLYDFTGGSSRAFNDTPTLTPDATGNLYGVQQGGAQGNGLVFKLSPNGSGGLDRTVLYNFCSQSNCADGGTPIDSVIFDQAGNLYGTTFGGGAFGGGVVFELGPVGGSWTETVLYSFLSQAGDGYNPLTGLVIDSAGNLYGTTWSGGKVFQLSHSGGVWTEQVIFNEGGDGNAYAGLNVDSAGNIFGVSISTVFKLSPDGNGGWTHTVLHTFAGTKDGNDPYAGVTLDPAGNLYGATAAGGVKGHGVIYKLSPGKNGKWTEKILYSFKAGKTSPIQPVGGVTLDSTGNIFGTAQYGGSKLNDGVVFELVAPVGKGSYKFKTSSVFYGTDGNWPCGTLIRDSAGNLYGIAPYGGQNSYGVVFQVTP